VGYFAPNGYGLFDMAGNDDEWCWDWYGSAYAGGTDPRGPVSGTYRTQRGGYYYNYAHNLRTAVRAYNLPANVTNALDNFSIAGFRCARGL
jgi:formylglycine-generating enzyme required for sulfatase activity